MATHQGFEITETRIRLAHDPERPGLKAYANLVLNGCFKISHIRIVQIGMRTVVAFPSRKWKDGTHHDVASPINDKTRRWFESVILTAYCDAAAQAYREAS